jgi:hypothetical protein
MLAFPSASYCSSSQAFQAAGFLRQRDVIDLLVSAGAFLGLGTLVFSGISHARDRAGFRAVLGRQGIWPERTVGFVACAVIGFELGIGALGAIALAAKASVATPLLLSGLLYLAYGFYAANLMRTRPQAPCGCSSGDEPVNGWVVIRAVILAVGSLGAALLPDRLMDTPATDARFAITVLVAAAFAVILWNLPAAVHDPTRGYVR